MPDGSSRIFGKLKTSLQGKLDSLTDRDPSTTGTQPPNKTSKPSTYHRPSPLVPYWTANFDTRTSVAQEWRQETGDNGWGNNELQNYTTSERNSEFCEINGRQCLVLRAIADGSSVTSARLTSKVALNRTRGFLSASIRSPSASMDHDLRCMCSSCYLGD